MPVSRAEVHPAVLAAVVVTVVATAVVVVVEIAARAATAAEASGAARTGAAKSSRSRQGLRPAGFRFIRASDDAKRAAAQHFVVRAHAVTGKVQGHVGEAVLFARFDYAAANLWF